MLVQRGRDQLHGVKEVRLEGREETIGHNWPAEDVRRVVRDRFVARLKPEPNFRRQRALKRNPPSKAQIVEMFGTEIPAGYAPNTCGVVVEYKAPIRARPPCVFSHYGIKTSCGGL